MELFRALAVLAEPPSAETAAVAGALGLGAPPDASEYTEVFVFQLYPYASVYLGAEGMLGGEARDRVAGFWRALGEAPPSEPDHLSLLLALYARLAELEEGEDDTLRRAGWRGARVAFLWEHLLSWLPVYLSKLARIAAPVYRRWGEILTEALTAEARRAGAPETLPLQLRESCGLMDPRGEATTEEFLQSVLAPARCGMILVRADLSRAARSLGLGARIAERRFVLRSLLGQDARATLRWLEEEAAAWADEHRRLRTLSVAISEAWEEKSQRAARLLRELRDETGAWHNENDER
jgi:TorA maturation chaperone TorD